MNNITDLARYLWNETIRNDGATVNIFGFSPDDGWMVGGVDDSYEYVWDAHTAMDLIERFIVQYVDVLMSSPELFVGTWIDNGKLYIDISERYATEVEALEVAIIRDELAIYNLTTHETIKVKE